MKTVNPEDVGLSPERLARITPVMQAHINSVKLPGLVTLIARRAQIAYTEPYGLMDVEAKKPMTLDAIFRIASMTKPVTSTAVMMLYEQGLF
jgi:CubicO group peptidase (beta-lactamase class C family)